MRIESSNRRWIVARVCALGIVGLVLAAVYGTGCELGGKEGDRCNPLVLHDECNSSLHCTRATCSEAYCCPVDRSSSDPHCNAAGCPDADAGDEGGTSAAATDASSSD